MRSGRYRMVNDPTLEREDVGSREAMDDPAQTDPQTTKERPDRELEAPDFAPDVQRDK
jgi:hypothetical protein